MNKTLILGLLAAAAPLLAEDAVVPPVAPAFSHSLYIRLGAGMRLIPSQDFNRQFTSGSSGPDNPDFWIQDTGLAIGYQSPSPFGLELGVAGTNFLSSGLAAVSSSGAYNDVKYTGRVGSQSYDESFFLGSYYVMPSMRMPAPGLFGRPCINTLGLKIASTTLTGYSDYSGSYSSYYGYSNSYYTAFKAQTTTYEVDYRLEQMLGQRISLGLDLGYGWANFSPTNANGVRAVRLDGSPLSLDLSGPRVALSLSIWIMRPFVNAAEDLARIRERQQARKERLRARYGDVSPSNGNSDTAQRLVEKGDALMQEKSYDLAGAMYQQAVSSDVNSRWGWQGLGNANYYQGLKDEALKAYYRAFALSEGDEKLKAMIERLKHEGAKGKP